MVRNAWRASSLKPPTYHVMQYSVRVVWREVGKSDVNSVLKSLYHNTQIKTYASGAITRNFCLSVTSLPLLSSLLPLKTFFSIFDLLCCGWVQFIYNLPNKPLTSDCLLCSFKETRRPSHPLIPRLFLLHSSHPSSQIVNLRPNRSKWLSRAPQPSSSSSSAMAVLER